MIMTFSLWVHKTFWHQPTNNISVPHRALISFLRTSSIIWVIQEEGDWEWSGMWSDEITSERVSTNNRKKTLSCLPTNPYPIWSIRLEEDWFVSMTGHLGACFVIVRAISSSVSRRLKMEHDCVFQHNKDPKLPVRKKRNGFLKSMSRCWRGLTSLQTWSHVKIWRVESLCCPKIS